nr:fasciclin domain-containing protein [uncultured Flavobacterium sp.]
MKRKINYYLLILPLLALFASCSRDVFDEYYARPDYLEDPIYQRLEELGNYKNFTALIEKAGYKDILSKSGYWTMFAPNDAAFTAYFQENGISSVSQIDEATATKIVKYALVYNAFREDQLSDYQSAQGWVKDNAFRRRTAFYDGYQNKIVNGTPMVVVDANRNGFYFLADNNNKYVTYFTDEYFAANNLSSYDFNYFYPDKEYTGFNLFDGGVQQADIIAENGIIHEVDKVSLPPLSIGQYLEKESDYSIFRSLLEDNLTTYQFSQNVTTSYKNFTGKSDDVYIKFYDSRLAFSPNNENFIKEADNDGQSNGYTLLVPNNAALETFKRDVLLKHYTMDLLPKYVFQDFINAHMVQGSVWPSQTSNFENGLNEELRFNFNTDIIDAKILSNGFFYGTNKVQESNLFYSVYTSAYLDPKFTLATRLFNDGSGIKEIISNIANNMTLFLPSDAVLSSLGYRYNLDTSQWVYTNPSTGVAISGVLAQSRLFRLLYNGVVFTPNGELDNIATTSGVIRTGDGDQGLPGEYIRWDHNKVYAAGNELLGGTPVNIVGTADIQRNGRTYYIDNVLQFSEELQGLKIKRLAEMPGSQFLSFYNYLKTSSIYDAATGKFSDVNLGTSYTFLIPNNAAIAQAVADGVLPVNTNPTLTADKNRIANFIKFHILATKTVSDDGQVVGNVETLRDVFGEKTYVKVAESTPGILSFTDEKSSVRTANFIKAQSNNLADRSLIHLIDNYLLYTE